MRKQTAESLSRTYRDWLWGRASCLGRARAADHPFIPAGCWDKVLLMTKLRARTLEEIKAQLETSLIRFGLDSFALDPPHDARYPP
jgi:hypothetical protein